MPKTVSIQNKFTRGLITEAHGLDFPEDACTSADNCIFTLIGEVTRRLGIDLEVNYSTNNVSWNSQAISSFRWTNAGGDGETEVLVLQIGSTLYFYESSRSTTLNPLSNTLLSSQVFLSSFQGAGNFSNIASTECQYATGNGYLFVFHPDCDPFYCTFNNDTILANVINIQIRDFLGYYPEPANLPINVRPTTLTNEHNYNLQNQGWTGVPTWVATDNNITTNASYTGLDTTNPFTLTNKTGTVNFTVQTGLSGVTPGQSITASWGVFNQLTSRQIFSSIGDSTNGTVISYNSGTGALSLNLAAGSSFTPGGGITITTSGPFTYNTGVVWTITPGNVDNSINTFFSDVSVYPADCDIWYTFKDVNGLFNPTTTYGSVLTTTTPAPRGHFILDAFNQNQSGVSGVSGITNLSTTARPATGTWFQGRVWYAGANGVQQASGDQNLYTWSENIYFSQVITPGDVTTFGNCYQLNDPTSETLFDILPTDGGVISIQGCGNIFKLFPVQNGILVFAQNGVWFITGGQSLGFTATDYTITKISSVQSISSFSYVDVYGLPYFWNEEGIYRVVQSQGNVPYGHGGLIVEPITTGTILSFYNEIPKDSKIYARGYYNPISYILQWTYRGTQETGLDNRYLMDSILNLNIAHSSFYPFSISSTASTPYIAGVFYLNYPNSIIAPDPNFKYIALCPNSQVSFADEHDFSYHDWVSTSTQDYVSSFTTGYNLQGHGIFKYQPTYVQVFSRNADPWAYTIEGIWDYSINQNSGKQTTILTVINALGQPNFGMLYRRHKIRGHGMVLQLNFSSVSGQPFDIMGWTMLNQVDAGL